MIKEKKNQTENFKLARKVAGATGPALAEIASMIGWTFSMRPIGLGWAEYEDKKARQLVYEEKEYLRQLQRSKFIETKRIGKKLMIRLTAKGWQRALRDKIRTTEKKCHESICLVIFDVPESERHVRDALRDVLNDLGFEMIQKSVWATENDVIKELCALLQGANLCRWVRIIAGKEVNTSFARQTLLRFQATTQARRSIK